MQQNIYATKCNRKIDGHISARLSASNTYHGLWKVYLISTIQL